MTADPTLSRRAVLGGAAAILAAARPALADRALFPGAAWATGTPAPPVTGTARAAEMLKALPTTAMMVVQGGQVVWQQGDVAEVSYLASARKSILSMLYGRAVTQGTIDLDRTVGDIGIDDVGGLLPLERTARVRDLLTARSGVYHPAGSPGSDPGTPARGSKQPGEYFFYNNWDFNVAGAVFERLTGRTVFKAFEEDLAGPLQMQDYDPARQRMLGFTDQSQYLAYHFFLSGRDMARLGLLMARGGQWNGQQLVPAAWVRDSTSLRVPSAAMSGPFKDGGLGYGYLWWVPERAEPAWQGAFLANGNYGQFILGLPAIDTVVVHRRAVTDAFAIGRNMGTDNTSPSAVSPQQFLRVAEALLAP